MTRRWKIVLLVSLIGNLTVAYVGYKAHEYRTNINYWLDKYLRVVDEFSEREVFAEANAALQSDTIVPGRIVFFGTQVTSQWPLAEFFPEYETINRGVDGQRAAGFLLRFRPDVIELQPRFVVIEVSSYNFRPGTSIEEIIDYVTSLAELARAHAIQPILTTCIPPRSDFELDEHPDYSVTDTASAYNIRLKELAATHEFLLADWGMALADKSGGLSEDLSINAVELNRRGYELISAQVVDLIDD